MKTRSLEKYIILCLMFSLSLTALGAQTVLVHSDSLEEQGDENIRIYKQSAEAGILDVLFDRGCITFSDMSEVDESGILNLAKKTGADYIISWSIVDSGLRGNLVQTIKSESIEHVLVEETELEGRYNDPSELYSALGSRLCESLVGKRW
ncbi:hypothetical protein [Oceanispirochaeta sp.]|jgi:hypothetical protein|uniref:hypothetical protein n=1 Tax=Oceanispirochaeta sp. TaxID=2035350 RepID=UPI0026258A29|nr:hypothetical protein [Oceanispirochaeta sp.]MDA3956429.1 hypothetical protein [Oceanispirochaeta sp.]